MANNRSYLCCVACLLDPNKEAFGDNGCIFSLFKYYPTTGWYIMCGESDKDKIKYFDDMNAFLDRHKGAEHWASQKDAMYGQFIMIFETQFNDPFVISKNETIDKLLEIGAIK